jgi:hypothetical protein
MSIFFLMTKIAFINLLKLKKKKLKNYLKEKSKITKIYIIKNKKAGFPFFSFVFFY